MDHKKYARRWRNLEWAYAHLSRAFEGGDHRRVSRAAFLIESLESWMAENAPQGVSTFRSF